MTSPLGFAFNSQEYISPQVYSYTHHSGTNRRMDVVTAAGATAVTYDGINLTYEYDCTTFRDPIKKWFLPDASFPDTPGAYNFSVTYGTTQTRQILIIMESENAHQGVTDYFYCKQTAYAAVNQQVQVKNDSAYIYDILFSEDGNTFTAQSSQTEHVNGTTGDGRRWVVGGKSASGTSIYTVESNWTQSAATDMYSMQIPIRDYSESKYEPTFELDTSHSLTDQSATASTSITCTTDDDATVGNLLILNVNVDKNSGTFNAITGWELAASYNYANGSSCAMYWREADGTATDNSVTATFSISEQATAWIDEYSGAANGWQLLDAVSNGSAASAVTSVSSGTTGTISNVPALAIVNRSADSNLVTNEYPFLTNQFMLGQYKESVGNYTVQGWAAHKEILSSSTVETTWSDPAGSSVRMCSALAVFADTGGASTNDCTVAFSSNAGTWTSIATQENSSTVAAESAGSDWTTIATQQNPSTVEASSQASDWTLSAEQHNAAMVAFESASSDWTALVSLENPSTVVFQSSASQWIIQITDAGTNVCTVAATSPGSDWIAHAEQQNTATVVFSSQSSDFVVSVNQENAVTIAATSLSSIWEIIAQLQNVAAIAATSPASEWTIILEQAAVNLCTIAAASNGSEWSEILTQENIVSISTESSGSIWTISASDSSGTHTYRIKVISEDRTIKLLSEDRIIKVIS